VLSIQGDVTAFPLLSRIGGVVVAGEERVPGKGGIAGQDTVPEPLAIGRVWLPE
jgi:hypothetical protein